MTDAIEVDQFLAHSPSVVWEALTDPALSARWLVPGDVKAVVGHQFTLDMGSWGTASCEVTQVELERLLVYTFANPPLNTTISWRLEPEGGGTRLFLVHDGFGDDAFGRQAREGMGNGWPSILRRLEDVMSGEQAQPCADEAVTAQGR